MRRTIMAKYRIFAGLGGGFGGVQDQGIEDYDNLADAEEDAYEVACEIYESYEGMHGLFNREKALEEDPDLTDEELEDMYNEDRENWIEYLAELVSEEDYNNYIKALEED